MRSSVCSWPNRRGLERTHHSCRYLTSKDLRFASVTRQCIGCSPKRMNYSLFSKAFRRLQKDCEVSIGVVTSDM